ncbi:uncharacterized protein [Arachis hypogaea]|uniref:uncharacterized protein isoform X3 n=1 Tax=Arachis hypogaea TaxID=3818 RepID=UPI000DEC9EF1|nr:uncharacterized protein LOC112750312 isoform X2 [Arachis hypogaea]
MGTSLEYMIHSLIASLKLDPLYVILLLVCTRDILCRRTLRIILFHVDSRVPCTQLELLIDRGFIGMLVSCPFKDPASIERATSSNDVSKKRYVEMLELDNVELRAAMKSVKNKVLKTKRSYSEDFKYFGVELSNV